MKRALIGAICGLGLLSSAHAQVIVNLDLGNNAVATNAAGFTKLSTTSGDYAVKNGSYYLWTNVANSGLNLTMTNIAPYGGTGALDADGFYNISGNGPAYFTISNLPAGTPVTLYACWAWNSASHAPIIFFGGTQITVTNNGEMANPSLATLQNVGTATAAADGTVSGYWYGDEGGTPFGHQEGQIGALIINVGPCRPVVMMNGANPMGIHINTPFTDPGATAIETCGNPVTLSTNGTVNTTSVGTYTLTYTAISTADNATNTVNRTVNVWNSDMLNLDLAQSGDPISTPAGFDRLNWANSNPMTFSALSVNGSTYTVGFTNLSGSYSFANYNTLDQDGFYVSSGVTAGFYVTGLNPGDMVTLYACWGWNGAADPGVITYGGATKTLNVGADITAPSTNTFMQIGTAVVDDTGTVRGTWTGQPGKEGQIGGMIFSIGVFTPGVISVSPSGITNSCPGSATFTATPLVGATNYQWYNPSFQPIPSATNATLVLTNTHPSDSGSYMIVETGPTWASTNSVVLLTTDTAPPVMTLNGNSTILLGVGSTYTELGATAYDTCAGSSLSVTTTGTVNTGVAGEYDITYSAITGDGIPGSLTRAVVVIDPTVVVPGISMNLDFGAATDANPLNPITPPAGWSLLAYGDIYQSPNIWGSPSFPNPDGNNPGLTLSFGNISGWSTASSEANGANSSAVVGISTNGLFNYGSKGSGLPATFTLSGVPVGQCVSIYVVDGWDGAAKAPVIIYGGQTNTVTAGSFDVSPTIGEFQYVGTAIATNGSVTGSWTGIGGPTAEGQIGGMIIQVQSIPLNNLAVAPSSVTAQCGSNLTFTASAYGLPPITYQWYDNNTNAIPGATNASYTLLDPTDASAGNYTVVAQNAYASLTNVATITSVLHTAPPVMALNGVNPVNVMVNTPYADAGATAYDLCAQASLTVSSNSTVNISVIGTYTVTYFATTTDGTPGTITRTVIVGMTPNFGPNVLIFDPTTTNIQSQLNSVFAQMQYNQFGTQRYALLFKPGQYANLDVDLGFYTQVLGLGQSPDGVTISGDLHSDGILADDNATENFWRSAENLAVIPTSDMIWAVSQGTALRRVHVQGNLYLADFTDQNWASGGFMADSKVDATMSSISQQQWLSRNDIWGNWSGEVWNMVFVGVSNPPAGTWPSSVYTVITSTPLIREKPYLSLDTNGNYVVMVPALETNSVGTTWAAGPTPAVSIPITQFYVAHADTDNAATINAALNAGLNLILTPGVYQLTDSLLVTRPDTIILGLGYATLIPQTGTPALTISDVDGVEVAGLLFDAGPAQSTTLLQVGSATGGLDHSRDPIFLYDISMRVGGAAAGATLSCLRINANDVVGDNLWLWRADHGNGVGWTQNPCNNGLVVNGDRVTMYGLFVEHHEQYQTLWNGNWGRLYFYQSELPYDPPSQDAWSHDGENGYASYKVADQVTSHQAYGLGIYAVFINCTNISCFNAIETSTNSQQVNVHDMITVYIAGYTSGSGTTAINHIINGTGPAVSGPGFGGTATANYLWLNPTFSVNAGLSGANAAISFPSESWHSYQLQYKNALTDSSWLNLGGPVGGNDVLQTITDPTLATNRFYRVGYQ